MKAKFTVEALKEKNSYKVCINGIRVLTMQASCVRDIVLFLVSNQLATTLDCQCDVFESGGGTVYLEYIPDVYDNQAD